MKESLCKILNPGISRTLALRLGIAVCAVWLIAVSGARSEEPAAPEKPAIADGLDRSHFEQGRFVYEANCAICHGLMGDGRGEMSGALGIKPRSFRSGLFKYRSTPWGKLPTTDDLRRTVRNGISGTAMGMFTRLSESDLRAVVEYIKFFSRKWRKAENYGTPITLPPEPAWLTDKAECERHASKGKQTFQMVCAACHGPAGDGKGLAAPALKDDFGDPAPPADLRQPHLQVGDDPTDLYRTLMTGLNGTPMVSFADTLTEQQKWDLVAFILKLRRDFDQATK